MNASQTFPDYPDIRLSRDCLTVKQGRSAFTFLAPTPLPSSSLPVSNSPRKLKAWMRSSPNEPPSGCISSIPVLSTWERLDTTSLHSFTHGYSSSRPSCSLMQQPLLLSLLNHCFVSIFAFILRNITEQQTHAESNRGWLHHCVNVANVLTHPKQRQCHWMTS